MFYSGAVHIFNVNFVCSNECCIQGFRPIEFSDRNGHTRAGSSNIGISVRIHLNDLDVIYHVVP